MLNRGFTLIELLVVITILAVLAGAALPYVQAYVEESRIAKAKTDLEEVARAIAVFETREGEYQATGVSQLTGRYLNKAPIDPWGKSYFVATDAGIVFSAGPDRSETTQEDNVIFPYQPPLALVNVKWIDRNNSGAVDMQNVKDRLQMTFSRRLDNVINPGFATNTLINLFKLSGIGDFDTIASAVTIVGSKTLILDVTKEGAFVPGSDTITVKENHGVIKDFASPQANYCIASQNVVILPQ